MKEEKPGSNSISLNNIVKFTINGQDQEYETEIIPKLGTSVYFS